jgi:hypothetical protein
MRQMKQLSCTLLFAGVLAVGCGSEGQGDPMSGTGAAGGAAHLPAGGPGVGGAAGTAGIASTGIDNFTGTWSYVAGTETIVCGDASQTDVLSGTIQLGKGVGADLVEIDDVCSINFDLSGSSAQIKDGQTCFQADDSTSVEYRYRAWTLSTSDGRTLTETGSATVMIVSDGASENCDYTVTGTLNKIAE